jgi:hypothetical protein
MVKSSDIARAYKVVEEDRLRRLVHQHEARQAKKDLLNNEILPRVGIIGMLAGWSLLSALGNIFNRSNQQ